MKAKFNTPQKLRQKYAETLFFQDSSDLLCRSFLLILSAMYDKESILKMLEVKKPELERKYHLSELGLFGSYARGDYNEQSDIDILVDFNSRIDGFQYIRLAHELEDFFKHKVDLVSRGGIKEAYLPYVEKSLVHV